MQTRPEPHGKQNQSNISAEEAVSKVWGGWVSGKHSTVVGKQKILSRAQKVDGL
jgi:hypothetical protein